MSHSFEIGKRIHDNGTWVEPSLIELADGALGDFEDDRHRDAVSKAGVCLEGILKKLLDAWQVGQSPRSTLGELIGAARDAKRAPESLVRRWSDANSIRIRAAHHDSDTWQRITDGDALLLLNVLDMTLAWGGEQIQLAEPFEVVGEELIDGDKDHQCRHVGRRGRKRLRVLRLQVGRAASSYQKRRRRSGG